MSIEIKKSDIKWGYLSQILNSGINLLLLPLVLNILSSEKLGIWYNFTSIGSFNFLLLDFGFSATMTRNIAYAWSGAQGILKEGFVGASNKDAPNVPLFIKVFNVSKIVYLIIALVAGIILLTVGTWYIFNISNGLINSVEYLPAFLGYLLQLQL